MDNFLIPIEKEGEVIQFEVIDYAFDEENRCKFEVLLDKSFVASFEPDRHGHLHICKNSGKVDTETLHLIAAKIEAYNF